MATNKLQWKRIAKGDRLPCDSLLMKKDGTIPSVVSGAGVKVSQDAYYLYVKELRSLPKEESEDEKMSKKCIELIKELKTFCMRDGQNECIAWLEKKCEQKPAEWSEEDERIIDRLCEILYACHNYGKCGLKLNEYSNLYDWLKSLRPQSHWKPSKEQMIALKCAITTADEKWVCMNTKDLESLYEDLKKLTE